MMLIPMKNDDLQIVRIDRAGEMRHDQPRGQRDQQRELLDVLVIHRAPAIGSSDFLDLHFSEQASRPEKQDDDQNREGDRVAIGGEMPSRRQMSPRRRE